MKIVSNPWVRFLAFAALAVGAVACNPPDDSPMAGEKAPDFEVTSFNSDAPVTLAAVQKDKHNLVILDFWATWCGPCKMLTPYVEDVYQKYKDKGVEAMAITNDTLKLVKEFEKKTPHSMPVYLDPNDVANNSYKVQGLPTVILIGKDGQVLYYATGFDQTGPQSVSKALDEAIAKAVS